MGKALVVDVINPVVSKVAALKKTETVGVIGTRATIRSNAYQTRLNEKNPALKVCSLATPLLAPMIEEGFFNNKISRTIIHNYLSRPKLRKIEVLILACTHYPLIKKEISEIYGTRVQIIDSAEIVAKFVEAELKRKKLLSERKSSGSCRFFVSDLTTSFEKSTQIFFRGKIKLELKNLWIIK